MGKRGPKPTPTPILAARGSRRGKARKREPKPPAAPPTVKPPDWLPDAAKRYWRELVPELERLKVLSVIDLPAVARYVALWAEWRVAYQFLRERMAAAASGSGLTYTIKDKNGNAKCVMQWPEVNIVSSLSAALLKLESEFGCTPAARARVETKLDEEESAPQPAKPDVPIMRIAN